ncbi:unnamed protein product [Plutella xylostella]|uniref:(diamondback moth) hypothetical protein n=1 Tax=Plutella xylostella TaxID=51655 RepID=A0A8S4FJR3_PLUXY|nr:unnamed protein product [Plutella xylostella]
MINYNKLLHDSPSSPELESRSERVAAVHQLVHQLPRDNRAMLHTVVQHLCNVVAQSDKNLMSVSNVAVCFGPTLLRAERETVASILEIKFYNVIVETLIENFRTIFLEPPPAVAEPVNGHARLEIKFYNVIVETLIENFRTIFLEPPPAVAEPVNGHASGDAHRELPHHIPGAAARCGRACERTRQYGLGSYACAERETVGSILEIKFYNIIVETLIENFRTIFLEPPPAVAEPVNGHASLV